MTGWRQRHDKMSVPTADSVRTYGGVHHPSDFWRYDGWREMLLVVFFFLLTRQSIRQDEAKPATTRESTGRMVRELRGCVRASVRACVLRRPACAGMMFMCVYVCARARACSCLCLCVRAFMRACVRLRACERVCACLRVASRYNSAC